MKTTKIISVVLFSIFVFNSFAFGQIPDPQLVIEEISIGSNNYGTEFRPPFIIVIIKNTGDVVKENLLIKAYANDEPMLNETNIKAIYPQQQIKLNFFWEPETGFGNFTFRVEILNSLAKTAAPLSTNQIQKTMQILYAANTVHAWITEQAVDYLIHKYPAYSEANGYLDSLKIGAIREDDYYLDMPGLIDPENRRYNRHFYRPVDENGLFVPFIFQDRYDNSYNWAIGNTSDGITNNYSWAKAIQYYDNNKGKAYRALGHVLHLIQDLTVPAHTHLDIHLGYEILGIPLLIPDPDDYEVYTDSVIANGGTLPGYQDYSGNVIYSTTGLKELWDRVAKESYYRNRFYQPLSIFSTPEGSPNSNEKYLKDMFPSLDWTFFPTIRWKINEANQAGLLGYWGGGKLDILLGTSDLNDWWECYKNDKNIYESRDFYYIENTGEEYPQWYILEFDVNDPENIIFTLNTEYKLLTEIFAEQLIPIAIRASAGAIKMFMDNIPGDGNDLEITNYEWDDDEDGIVEVGETIDLKIEVKSSANINNVDAVLITYDLNVTINDSTVSYPSISEGNKEWSDGAFDIDLGPNCGNSIVFVVRFTYEKDGRLYFQDEVIFKDVYAQRDWVSFEVENINIDDSIEIYSKNNNDSIFQSGEEIGLRPRIKNTGSITATDIDVSLLFDGSNLLNVHEGHLSYPDINTEGLSYPKNDKYYSIYADRSYAGTEFIDLKIECYENGESFIIRNALQITVEPEAWLSLSENEWNFGTLQTGVDITYSLIVTNRGSKVMKISNIDPSDIDTEVNDDGLPWTLYPGQSRGIDITIQTSTPGNIERKITIISDGRIVKDNNLIITGVVGDSVPLYKLPKLGKNPDISGNIIVWEDTRNGNSDIYAYSIITGGEKLICGNSANQSSPKISGNLIAWNDLRNWDGTGYGIFDIYAYDLTEEEELSISIDTADEGLIGVDGNKVVFTRGYVDLSDEVNGEILSNLWMYNHESGSLTNITNFTSNINHEPMKTVSYLNDFDFNGNQVVWQEIEYYWNTQYNYWGTRNYKIMKMKFGEDSNPVLVYEGSGNNITTNGSKIAWHFSPNSLNEIWIWENGVLIETIASDDIEYDYPVLGDNFISYFKRVDTEFQRQLVCRDFTSKTEKLFSSQALDIDEESGRMDGDNFVFRRSDNNEIYYAFLNELPPPPPPPIAPDISLSSTSLNIGEVDTSDIGNNSFIIFNEGNADLVVSNISSDNSNFTVEPDSTIIFPGNNKMVTVSFNPIAIGADSATITITSNDSDEDTLNVSVKGIGTVTGITDSEGILPKEFKLHQNYPNPFNPETTISFQIPKSSFVTLKIYNIAGQHIKTLISESLNPDVFNVIWDGKNKYGQQVSSGVYLYHLQAGRFSIVKKMLYIR